MKWAIVLLAIVSAASALEPSKGDLRKPWKGGLRVKFDLGLGVGKDFFFELPRTVGEAVKEGWAQVERPEGSAIPQLVMHCSDDRIVCPFYDDTEHVAGLQVAFPADQFTDYPFEDNTVQGFKLWTPSVQAGNTPITYITTQQYFVTEESLTKYTKEERLAKRDNRVTLQEGGVWVTGIHSELVKISNAYKDIIAPGSPFTKQACIPWMGRHYYYNMSSTTECTAEGLFPWFPLIDSGELVGTGFMTFGNLPIDTNKRDWFERPAESAVKVIVPSGPDCLYNLAGKGVLTMHIYYIDTPQRITCLFQ